MSATLDAALLERPTATDAELAAEMGVSAKTVSRARKRLGLTPPAPPPSPDAPSPEQLASARAALLSGLSLAQAGERTGVSKYHLEQLRRRLRAELGPEAAQPRLRGRPRTRLSVPVSADEVADLERQAIDEGVSVEDLVRRRALEVVPGDSDG